MKPNTYLVCLMSLLSTFGVAQTNLHTESFETDGEGSRYTSGTFAVVSGDYFLRTTSAFADLEGDVSSGIDGSYFWVGEDVDDATNNPFSPQAILQLQDIDVAGYSTLELKVLLAQTETPNADRFENNDGLIFQYAMDGNIGTIIPGSGTTSGTYTTFATFRGNVSGGLGSLALDTDMNGVGDGSAVTSTLQDFTLSIPVTGSTLSIRIIMAQDQGTEEIYMDNLRIEGTVACTDPDIPTVTATASTICPGASSTLQITGSLNDATAWNVYTGSCGGSLLGTTATSSFNVSPASTTTYYIRGEGGCVTPGSCGTVTVTVQDNTDPTITCPGNQTLIANSSCQASLPDYTGLATASDDCDASPTITQSPAPGTTVTGDVTVTLTATDASANTKQCNFNVVFSDTTRPSISCPGDQTVYASASCQTSLPNYTGLAVTTDNCDGSPVVTQSPTAGNPISANTVVTLTSTDATGNTNTCSFNVTFSDTTRPVITCPSDQSLYADVSCQASLPDYTGMASSSDNCDGSPVITQSPSAGNIITADTMVVLTSTDASGNTDTCSFMVHFSDTTRPVLVCPSDQIAYVNGSCQATIGDYTSSVTLSDNCDGSPILTQAPPSGTVITADAVVTMTATDGSGNVATCTFNVLFTDTTKPVITCRTDTLICNPVFSYTPPIGTDQCAGAITTQTDGSGYTSGSTFPTGETVQQYTVTDAGGNQATCQFTVTVPPPSQANAGNDFFICSADGMLDGNVPQYGTGRWKLILGSAKVQDSLDPKSSITVLVPLPSVAYFEWFIQGPCDSSRDTVMVTRYAPVEPTVMVTDSLLTCNPVATTYQWFLNGDTIPGATNKTYVALVTGSYTVHVLDTNGCRDSSEIVNVIITGIADGGNPYQVEVFPNPFSQQINMGFTLPAGQTYRITMYNILGKAVAGGTGTASGGRQSHAMDAAALRPGVYFVSFESGQYKVMHKLIRE
ncbi:MAG: HYR domain-containing protein [Flavobacteriales bacterium]|nr:HYR domain-containing protein [Flavobacteriales bacterium]